MGWIGKSMLDFKEKSVKLYPVPKRVQELIPVHRISEDGIFELEKKPEDAEKLYDKAYWFEDANFSTMDDDGKTEFLKLWCKTLNSLNVSYKILVMNANRDMEKVKGLSNLPIRKSMFLISENMKKIWMLLYIRL